MAKWGDVRSIALALPETAEGLSYGHRAWTVKGKVFLWERPLRKSDLLALGSAAPTGPILGARVIDLDAKDALLELDPKVYFTTPHFDGHAAVLVRLDRITAAKLKRLAAEAWRTRAPSRLAKTLP
jgi:hypothetical protein